MSKNRRTVAASVSLLLALTLRACHSCAGVRIPTQFLTTNNNYNKYQNEAHHLQRRDIETQNADTSAIPLEFYKELDDVKDMSDFIQKFVPDLDSIDPQLGLLENLKHNVERAASVKAKPANCMPESTTVPLVPETPSTDPNVIYFPKCTRVKRCGGCCSSELMSCQPTESEMINFEVTKYHYGSSTSLIGKQIIPVEQHNRCKCSCLIKASDCNKLQIYREDLCRCTCKNADDMSKCTAEEHKIWQETDCRCACRESQTCTTGTIYDENECKCVSLSTSVNLEDRRRFIVKAIPIEPDNSTIYTI